MMRAALGLVALLTSLVVAHAEPSLVFRGDQFVRKSASGNEKARLIEFVPPDQTLENWTQLIGYRAIFDSPQTALQAASAIAAVTQQRFPGAMSQVRSKGDEPLVDFLLAPASGEYIEFNVFKYAPGKDGRGIVSLQYARRFRGLAPENVRALGGVWAAEAASFDMQRVRTAVHRNEPAGF